MKKIKETKGKLILFSVIGLLIGFIIGIFLTPVITGESRKVMDERNTNLYTQSYFEEQINDHYIIPYKNMQQILSESNEDESRASVGWDKIDLTSHLFDCLNICGHLSNPCEIIYEQLDWVNFNIVIADQPCFTICGCAHR